MNISDLTKLIELVSNKETKENNNDTSSSVYPWQVGKNYFIRTVTMHFSGKLIGVTDKELLLSECCWIADTGRFHDALKTGEFEEIEPFINDVIVNRNCIIDGTIFDHALPKVQK